MRRMIKPLFKSLPADCSMSYRNLFSAPTARAKAARDECEELWRGFHNLADKDFVDRFPFEFQQRWFEMYLGAGLRDANLDVSAPKPGPDFCITVAGRPIYIEAIVPEAGSPFNPDHVPEPAYTYADGGPIASRVPHDLITLRLAGAFHKKAGVYNRYRVNEHVSDNAACIVAINVREIPHAWADSQEYWIRALYGVGDRFVSFDRDGSAAVEGRQHREMLRGSDGHAVSVAALLSTDYAHVSGVIGSSASTGNLRGPLGDDFALMPHALATSPYPAGFIARGIELKLNPTEAGAWSVETRDYGGLDSQGPHTIAIDYEGVTKQATWSVSGRSLTVQVDSRGRTVAISRSVDPAAFARDVAVELMGFYGAEARARRRT